MLLADRVVVLGTEARGIAADLALAQPRPRDRRDLALPPARARVLDALQAAHAL